MGPLNPFVPQSRFEVNSDRVHFPPVSGFNLNRQERQFPRDFAGEINLLFVAFLMRHQIIINTWAVFAEELEARFPGLAYYELPTIDQRSMLARTFINEGMRAGIPDPRTRERTVTLYIDTVKFMRATGIPDNSDVHILLVDRQGDIQWRTTGYFDEAKSSSLVTILEQRRALAAP